MLSGKQSAHQVSQCVFLALEEEGHIELLHLRVCVCVSMTILDRPGIMLANCNSCVYLKSSGQHFSPNSHTCLGMLVSLMS